MIRLLLCTDLDRTLLPNGTLPESDNARPWFSKLVSHPEVTLVYVTGRDRSLVNQAIRQYDLPEPAFVIADVGSTIYRVVEGRWEIDSQWELLLQKTWQGNMAPDLIPYLEKIDALELQESSKQGRYKLSYYVRLETDHEQLIRQLYELFESHEIAVNIIWSVDDIDHVGLLDILPANSGKQKSIEYLIQRLDYRFEETLFAGDSGNDIAVMASPLKAVLVANATDIVKKQAEQMAHEEGNASRLYLAQGGYAGMNGNYAAGILEGVMHFFPECRPWVEE